MIGVITITILLGVSIIAPSTGMIADRNQATDYLIHQRVQYEDVPVVEAQPIIAPEEGEPIIAQDEGDSDEPLGWVEGDFIISYDESDPNFNDANRPSIVVTPTGRNIPEEWHGSIHAVWQEIDEAGVTEIHYSTTNTTMDDYPQQWTGEKEDRAISEIRPQGRAAFDNAINASICVDQTGTIHIVWAQQYSDNTWEVHYSQSKNNGYTWSSEPGQTPGHDIVVSYRAPKAVEATSVTRPTIAVGTNWASEGTRADPPLYVAWAENYYGEAQEVHFKRSMNGGLTWIGDADRDIVLSNTQFAHSPCIVATGDSGEIVNVAWKQWLEGKQEKGDDIYFRRNTNYGAGTPEKDWSPEEVISVPGTPSDIGHVEMVSGRYDFNQGKDGLHVVWEQVERSQKALPAGIFYSFNDSFAWKQKELQIDKFDGHAPVSPSICVNQPKNIEDLEVQVVWTEYNNEVDPTGTYEIHISKTDDPWEQARWTGREKDIIISWPAGEDGCDAKNPSISMGLVDGSWTPLIAWHELNNPSTGKGPNRATRNDEIHTDPPPIMRTIEASDGSNGEIDPEDSVAVVDGDDKTFNFYPNTGYHVSQVKVDGSPIGSPSSYTFINVDADHTIHVDFAINIYSLTVYITPGGSGSVTLNPPGGSYNHGTTVTMTANANTGWNFNQWTGSIVSGTNPYPLYMNGHKTVWANFLNDTHTITVTVDTNGTISPPGPAEVVNYGDDKVFIITPDSGYAIEDVVVDSVSVGATSTYTFNSVITDHTIQADFIPQYTQSLSTGWNRVSFPLVQVSTTITTVLNSINSYWTDARFYDASDGADHWKSYQNGVGGDLTNVDHKMGIWVYVTSPCTLTLTGERPGTTDINLYTGWNMVGYPANNDGFKDVGDLKAQVPQVSLVYKEDWCYLMTELSDTHVLKNGEFYWVFVTSDVTWTITW